MYVKTIFLIAALISSFDLIADIRTDVAAGKPLLEIVADAKADDISPADTTRALLAAGQAAPRAAYSVARVWADCEATSAAVDAATRANPDAASAIVLSVGGLSNCGCSSQSLWSRTRIETRLRPTTFQRPVEITTACTCLSTAVEAASNAAPDQLDRIVQAAARSGQELNAPISDSVGDRTFAPEGALGRVTSADASSPQIFRRQPNVCDADRNDSDEFRIADQWVRLSGTDFSGLGQHQMDCREDDEQTDRSESQDDLLISEFLADPGGGSFVELYNTTNEPIDLESRDLRIAVIFEGLGYPSESIALRGEVAPGETFVVSGANAPAAVLQRSQQLVPNLSISSVDTLNVHSGWKNLDCGCTEAVVASALRSSGSGQVNNPEAMAMNSLRIGRSYGELDNVQPGFVVDSIGQAGGDSSTSRALLPALSRNQSSCEKDPNELDGFNPGSTWQFGSSSQSGASPHQSSCGAQADDLVIAGFVDAQSNEDLIKIHNPTFAELDLGNGYVVELYEAEKRSPTRVIALDGMLASGRTALITHRDLDVDRSEVLQLKAGNLELSQINAVVIRKVVAKNTLICTDPIVAATNEPPGEIYFVEVPARDPKNPPVHVDPIASPN